MPGSHRNPLKVRRGSKKRSEKIARLLFRMAEGSQDVIFRYRLKPVAGFEYISPAIETITGYSPDDHYQNPNLGNAFLITNPFPEDGNPAEPPLPPRILRWVRKDGVPVYTEQLTHIDRNAQGEPVAVNGIARKISFEVANKVASNEVSQLGSSLVLFSDELSHSPDIKQLVQTVIQGFKSLSSAERAILLRFDPSGDYICLWPDGFDNEFIIDNLEIIRGLFSDPKNIRSDILYTSEAAILPGIVQLKKLAEQQGYPYAGICPVIFEKKLLATVSFYYTQKHIWLPEEYAILETFGRQVAMALRNFMLSQELQDSYKEAIYALSKAIDVRDAYTSNHSHRMVSLSEEVAKRIGCTPYEVENIRWAALLHDIGKLGIPDGILLKPGPLSEEEWKIMKRHPLIGAEIINSLRRLESVAPLIRAHHENFDGSGYPDGLEGESIPVEARILSVVDAYGAMTEERVYRGTLSKEKAIEELKRCAGTQFDPNIVDVFIKEIPD